MENQNRSVLKVRKLYKSYKKGFIPKRQEVLKGVSFDIEPGKITGFLGANGAGKTTTMKCILGLAFPSSGEIQYFGDSALSSDVKKKIGFLPERPYFYDYLTGVEFLRFYGGISTDLSKKDLMLRINELFRMVDLEHAKEKNLRAYSKGMLQRIGLAQALIHNPDLVILDEPMAGLDPDGRYALGEIIKETASRGTAVFLSSHLLNDAERMCENLVILKNGKVVFEGKTSAMLSKLDSDYQIDYILNGVHSSINLSKSDSQKRLQELVKSGAEILHFGENSIGLEGAFVEMAFGGDEKL